MPYKKVSFRVNNRHLRRGYQRIHEPKAELKSPVVHGDKLLELIGQETVDQMRLRRWKEEVEKRELEEERWKAIREAKRLEQVKLNKLKEHNMTVSLYKSMASGAYEVVVQTNAQSLDIFISALADALHAALVHEASAPNAPDNSQALIAATLKNAFPVAFAISGYKAEKVSESKLLTCGFASPDSSELLAQSKQ